MMGKKITIDWEEKENVEWQEYKPKGKKSEGAKKLLITTDNFLPRWDGISRFLSEIVPRLKERYEITIVAPDYGHIEMKGVKIEKIPLMKNEFGDYTPASFAYKKIKRLIKHSDLVFNQALGPIGMCAILAASNSRRPLAGYIHSIEWELFPKALAAPLLRGPLVYLTKVFTRFFYNKCTLLIVPSENIAEHFSWQRVTTPKRIAHLGVDTDKFKPGNKKKARNSLGLPEDAFIVGFHGRISHEKNLLTLLRAFRRFNAKNKKLVIVGDGVLKIKSRLERFDDVMVTGTKNDVVPWLQSMDLYVQPSHTETTSLTVLEAMACGLPVITSKVGFIKHYITDEKDGVFFDNTSAYDLSLAIKNLHDETKLRDKLGKNARKKIEKMFQWDKTADTIKEILDTI